MTEGKAEDGRDYPDYPDGSVGRYVRERWGVAPANPAKAARPSIRRVQAPSPPVEPEVEIAPDDDEAYDDDMPAENPSPSWARPYADVPVAVRSGTFHAGVPTAGPWRDGPTTSGGPWATGPLTVAPTGSPSDAATGSPADAATPPAEAEQIVGQAVVAARGDRSDDVTPRGETARVETAPGETAPGETAPGGTAGGEAAPGGTARGETAEGGTARGETTRERTVQPEASAANASLLTPPEGVSLRVVPSHGPTAAGGRPDGAPDKAPPGQAPPDKAPPGQAPPGQAPPARRLSARSALPPAAPAAPPLTPPVGVPSTRRSPANHRASGTSHGPIPPRHAPAGTPPRGSARWTDPDAVAAQQAQQARNPDLPRADLSSARLLRPSKRPPQSGWRRFVYVLSGRVINPGESPVDVRRRELTARVNRPLLGCHKIAMLSLKGGVGKTTMTATLGATFASLRGDRVVAVDANPDRGTLSQKIPLETSATVRHLLRDAQRVRRYTDVRAYTSQGPSRLEVLASEQDPAVSEAFSEDDYRRTVDLLEHFYNIVLTDCGTGLMHSAMYGVLGVADQLIIVSSGSIDGARSASATMDWLDAHGHQDLVANSVAVINCVHRSAGGVDLDRVAEHFAARCRSVVRIPFDAHLEEGAEVDLDRLEGGTRLALLELAAAVADAFEGPPTA